jgi:hypothetical protein
MSDRPADPGLAEALRKARVSEAAHFEAVLDIRDAQTLRLQVLKDDLEPAAASSEARRYFDLVLLASDPPRLWIDLVGYVVMEPNPRTYRLVQDTAANREILHETTDRAAMAAKVREYMAHRLVARDRQLVSSVAPRTERRGYSTGALILAWLSGLSVGVLGLLIVGVVTGRLPASVTF